MGIADQIIPTMVDFTEKTDVLIERLRKKHPDIVINPEINSDNFPLKRRFVLKNIIKAGIPLVLLSFPKGLHTNKLSDVLNTMNLRPAQIVEFLWFLIEHSEILSPEKKIHSVQTISDMFWRSDFQGMAEYESIRFRGSWKHDPFPELILSRGFRSWVPPQKTWKVLAVPKDLYPNHFILIQKNPHPLLLE